jgi:pimeloyl-ACP methyl ester carboxylesterase
VSRRRRQPVQVGRDSQVRALEYLTAGKKAVILGCRKSFGGLLVKNVSRLTQLDEGTVDVVGGAVWCKTVGTGTPLLFLPGWGGPTDKYDAILRDLAARGYRVVLPDLPGLPGKTGSTHMILGQWGRWVEGLRGAAFSGKPFVLVSHSLSARIAIEYLETNHSGPLCSVFIGPWLISSRVNAALSRLIARAVRYVSPLVYPDMKWVLDRNAWKTALRLFSAVEGRPRVPCLVVFGKRDPANRLFGGWKRIGCEARIFDWGHSPQVTATSELAAMVDEFVRKSLMNRVR